MIRYDRVAAAAIATSLALGSPALAQTAVFPTAEPAQWARIEAGRPDFMEPAPSAGGLSSAWFFTVSFPIPGDVVMVGEVPVAYLDVEGAGAARMAIGNPYVGARMQFPGGVITEFEIGVRFPLAPRENEALGYGLMVDVVDRAEAFIYRTLPLTLRAVRTLELGGRTELDLAAGSIWWLMAGPEHTEQNIFATYSAQIRTGFGRLHLAAGASGRYSALGSPLEPLTGATQQVSATMDFEILGIRPGVFFTAPVGNTPGMTSALGIRALVPLGSD
jgi:hypothetical protein